MSTFRLSTHAISILRSQGWDEERMINIKDISEFLERKGIATSATAVDFLRAFHGLRILSPEGGISEANFDVLESVKFIEENEIAQLERILGQSLCPVGLGGRFLFFIAPTQDIYILHDEWFEYIHIKNIPDFFRIDCRREFQRLRDNRPERRRETCCIS